MERKEKILEILAQKYPNPRTALYFNSAFQLLIATMLSAQSTDKQVNQITKQLFAKYSTAEDFLSLNEDQLAEEIKGCGLYRNKSKNILATCRILVRKYGGQIPDSLEDLLALPGVGRKTANVVLSSAFGKPAIAVDTHVFRVANRLGLAKGEDVLKTEKELQKNIPQHLWSKAHHWLIFHGREICKARNPHCSLCELRKYCLESYPSLNTVNAKSGKRNKGEKRE